MGYLSFNLRETVALFELSGHSSQPKNKEKPTASINQN
jgi:hypothetical protein